MLTYRTMLLITLIIVATATLNCAGGIDDPGAFTVPDGQTRDPSTMEPPGDDPNAMDPPDEDPNAMDPPDEDPNAMDPPDEDPNAMDPLEVMDIAPPEFLLSACGGCHDENVPTLWQGLDLVADGVGPRVVQQTGACPEGPIIDPADPEASTLIIWMQGVEGCDTFDIMPPGQGVDDEQIAEALDWIDALDGNMDLGAASDSP